MSRLISGMEWEFHKYFLCELTLLTCLLHISLEHSFFFFFTQRVTALELDVQSGWPWARNTEIFLMSHQAWLRVLFKNVKSKLKTGTEGWMLCSRYACSTMLSTAFILLISQNTTDWAALQSRCLFGSGFGSLGSVRGWHPHLVKMHWQRDSCVHLARDRGPSSLYSLGAHFNVQLKFHLLMLQQWFSGDIQTTAGKLWGTEQCIYSAEPSHLPFTMNFLPACLYCSQMSLFVTG